MDLTGVSPIGKTATEAFPGIESDPFDWIRTFGHVAQTGEPVRFEQFLQSNNRWYDCVGYQYKLDHFVAAFLEITARKKAESALRESEAKQSAMIANIADVIAIIDPNGTNRYKSPNIEKWFGWRAEDVVGLSTWENVHPEDLERIQIFFGDLLKQPHATGTAECRYRCKNGTYKWIELTAVNLSHRADIGGMLLNYHDISERRKAEDARSESEARYQTLVESSPDSVGIHSEGKVIYVNPATVKLFNANCPEDLIGMPVIQFVHPDYRAIAIERVRHSYENHQPAGLQEEKFITRDGQSIDVEVTTTPIVHAGKPATQIIIRDIAARKQRENELQAIASLSAALRTAPTRAEMLPVIVEQLKSLLKCDSIAAEMIDPFTREAVVEAASGAWEAFVSSRQPAGTGLNAVITETRKAYRFNQNQDEPGYSVPGYFTGDLLVGAGVPLIAQDQLIGFLWMGRSQEIDESEFRLLVAVSDIATNALFRATLHEQTQKDATNLKLAYESTLEGWAHALELRDQETEGHTRRVVLMTFDLAQAMGIIDKTELENIRRGALLHDIGKMGIPDSVLLKPGTLNEREWEMMRRHPEYAYKFLEPIEYLRPVLDIPFCHHEKWDGSGYPRGLKGTEIPLVSRTFAIVDVWVALCSDRPYRPAWAIDKARNYILEQRWQAL